MAIDPLKSGGVNPPNGGRIDQSGANQSARQSQQVQRPSSEVRAPEGDSDKVQLSAQAKEAGATGATSESGLSSERLQEILKRLTSGYYDSPQVVDKVAQRVKDDLTGTGPA
jgi:anti-sigma28 factor (negative regulator of flagellin synthesis)